MQRFHALNRRAALLRSGLVALALALVTSLVAAAPGPFTLVSPGTGGTPIPFITDPASVTSFVWTAADAALTYNFALTNPDTTVLTSQGLTPGIDGDGLTCDSSTCTFSFSGAQFLMQQGEYLWTVTAIGNGSTNAGNAPFRFRVDSVPPGTFTLDGPGSSTAPGPQIDDILTVNTFTWSPAAGVQSYDLIIDRPPSTTDVTFPDLSPTSGLTCNDTVCSFSFNPAAVLIAEGPYSWTVLAKDDAGNTRSPSNGPYYFEVDLTPPPAAFALVWPGTPVYPGPTVNDASLITGATWGVSGNAETYNFTLIRPSLPVVEFTGLTPGADSDALTCSTTCALNFSGTALLAEDGVYRWTVEAVAVDGDTTPASNGPYFFNIELGNFELPGGFNLIAPENELYLRDIDNLLVATWGEAPGALSYEFAMYKIGLTPDVRLGEIINLPLLSPIADGDALTCAGGTCILTVPQSVRDQLDRGRYAWTAIARNNSGTREALNGPFYFSVDEGPVELVVNGGMEVDTDLNSQPDAWAVVGNLAGDRIRCNLTNRPNNRPDRIFANNGLCAYQFVGGDGRVDLRQNVSAEFLDALNLDVGDQLLASVAVRTNSPEPGAAIMRVIVRYSNPTAGANGDGRDRYVIPLNPATVNVYQVFNQVLPINGPVQNIRVILRYNGTVGRMYMDDASLILQPVPGAPLSTSGSDSDLLPLPGFSQD